jgi:hypothetical protein
VFVPNTGFQPLLIVLQSTPQTAVCFSGAEHNLLPVTRFQPDELEEAIKEMELVLQDSTQQSVPRICSIHIDLYVR